MEKKNGVPQCVYPERKTCRGCEWSYDPRLYDGGCLIGRENGRAKSREKMNMNLDRGLRAQLPDAKTMQLINTRISTWWQQWGHCRRDEEVDEAIRQLNRILTNYLQYPLVKNLYVVSVAELNSKVTAYQMKTTRKKMQQAMSRACGNSTMNER